jgi:putative RecB family exonuclease
MDEHMTPTTRTVATDDDSAHTAGPGQPIQARQAAGPAAPRALSPSRANDFKSCPLKFRYRTIDRIPEPPSAAAARGTLVHAVLQYLFSRAAAERTEATAAAAVPRLWTDLVRGDPDLATLPEAIDLDTWFGAARELLGRYFSMEDPARLEPDACELRLEVTLPDGVPTRGFVDRLDVSPGGLIRIVDYKTGKAPPAAYADDALFQLKFYALMLYRLRGVIAARLRLMYLGDGRLLEYTPDAAGLESFERSVVALWRAIERASASGDFPPRRSKLCDWCSFQPLCPAFGGTPPPYPVSPSDAARPGDVVRPADPVRPGD